MFHIGNGLKHGDALSPLLFNFAVEYGIRRVKVNQDGLKLNGTHQFLVYADDVNILEGRVHTVKGKAEALVVTGKETRRAVNAYKSKYIVKSRERNAGRSHSIKSYNRSFKSVEEFKYFGTTLKIKILFSKKLMAD